MTRPQYLLLFICALISFGLAVTLLSLHMVNQRAEASLGVDQAKLAQLQEEFNRGDVSRRLVQSIAQDLSGMVAQKPELQSLLARYGITLKKNAQDPN